MTEQELRDDMVFSGVLVGELLRELNRRCHKCAREGSLVLAEEWAEHATAVQDAMIVSGLAEKGSQ